MKNSTVSPRTLVILKNANWGIGARGLTGVRVPLNVEVVYRLGLDTVKRYQIVRASLYKLELVMKTTVIGMNGGAGLSGRRAMFRVDGDFGLERECAWDRIVWDPHLKNSLAKDRNVKVSITKATSYKMLKICEGI